MFEDSTFESTGRIKTRSRRWMLAALTLNGSILVALVLVPLIYPRRAAQPHDAGFARRARRYRKPKHRRNPCTRDLQRRMTPREFDRRPHHRATEHSNARISTSDRP